MHTITGRLVDITEKKIYNAAIRFNDGIIESITPLPAPGAPGSSPSDLSQDTPLNYILPGFIDAHVHIESSLLIPSEFARLAVVHGTVATVSDPHEIANVCGLPGVEFMIADGDKVPFYFNFGAPGCVPATLFETAGASLDAGKVAELLKSDRIKYLSEVMNFPGVLNKDPEMMAKIDAAHRLSKPVDGHAPGLRGAEALQYIGAGITTDHECFTEEEALDKLKHGMNILIREGSAAKNFEALIGLLHTYPGQIMFCSDDKHPDSLVSGHIDRLCARAVAKGIDVFKVLRAACINPVLHYNLDSGLLRAGDPADFIVVNNLEQFNVAQTWIRGQLVAENGQSLIPSPQSASTPHHHNQGHQPAASSQPAVSHQTPASNQPPINNFNCQPRVPGDFSYPLDKWGEQENMEQVYVIEALDGQLITNKLTIPLQQLGPINGLLQSQPDQDILKIVVVNRYQPAPIAKSFIRNFGLKRGAIASSVAHDSHNIVAVGVDDESICHAINLIIAQKGGLSAVDPGTGGEEIILPLPVAGLMSQEDGYKVAAAYTTIDAMAKNMGSGLSAPFMTLSFMALLVIPHLKLGDLGLFDGDRFKLL